MVSWWQAIAAASTAQMRIWVPVGSAGIVKDALSGRLSHGGLGPAIVVEGLTLGGRSVAGYEGALVLVSAAWGLSLGWRLLLAFFGGR